MHPIQYKKYCMGSQSIQEHHNGDKHTQAIGLLDFQCGGLGAEIDSGLP